MVPPPYKVVILGDSSVGKTSMVHRFVHNRFDVLLPNTIGAAFITKEYATATSTPVKLELWDTAGQERYRSLTPMYYRNAKIALICFDLSNPDTFEKAKYWIDQLQLVKDELIAVKLVATKSDLVQETPEFNDFINTVSDYARDYDFSFYKTSAKLGSGINEVFDDVVNEIDYKFFEDWQKLKDLGKDNSLNLIHESNPYGGCC